MILAEEEWKARAAAHQARVDALVGAHLERRRAGRGHPVHDFLFTYYSHKPSHLRRWHPGVGVTLQGAAPHKDWSGYVEGPDGVRVGPRLVRRRRGTVEWVRELLAATAARPAHTGCFGLHEWAMVYRTRPGDVRHEAYQLRLGHAGTDAVVEAHQLRCSHFDAFRFFTADARPRNALTPTRELQPALEQPGCLHANMDLYRHAYKLTPLVPSELVADAFELAARIRELDMRASPYDLSGLGYEPVRIETTEGKRQYVERQRAFAAEAARLRDRLLTVIDGELLHP
nr:3-methyladenine DNA glycosylase [Jiangella asiatica]